MAQYYFVICVQSRPALSLLGYCYYQLQDFVNAADCYEQLTVLNPEVDDYRLYYAQSLYKANLFDEAMKVSSQIDDSLYHDKVYAYFVVHICLCFRLQLSLPLTLPLQKYLTCTQ